MVVLYFKLFRFISVFAFICVVSSLRVISLVCFADCLRGGILGSQVCSKRPRSKPYMYKLITVITKRFFDRDSHIRVYIKLNS